MSRQPLDLYVTPPEPAEAIVRRVDALYGRPGEVLEPSAGPGSFVAAARRVWPGMRVTAADIDGAHREVCLGAGAVQFIEDDWLALAARLAAARATHLSPLPLLILGNPPYNDAEAHIEAALAVLRPGERLVFLLRHSFHGGQERIPFFERNPEAWSAIVLPRVPFVGATDMADSCVFCFEKGYRGPSLRAKPIVWGALAARLEAEAKQTTLFAR